MKTNIQMKPIGTAHEEAGRFYIQVEEPYRQALTNISGFSHLHVLFWAHECDSEDCRTVMVAKKPYKIGPDNIGVFATRSEYRPNPILLSIVPVLSVDEKAGVIELAFNDALDNSPVLDIKPYLPATDRVKNVKVTKWVEPWPSYYEDSATFDWPSVFNF
jgi:tRNA-Thr(GGU) m(6)t(6)A37 methyltransferase TsaA